MTFTFYAHVHRNTEEWALVEALRLAWRDLHGRDYPNLNRVEIDWHVDGGYVMDVRFIEQPTGVSPD